MSQPVAPPPFNHPPPAPPPKQQRTGLIVGLVIGAVVLLGMCVVGGGVAWYFLSTGEEPEPPEAGPSPTDYKATVEAPGAGTEYEHDFASDGYVSEFLDSKRLEKMLGASATTDPGSLESDNDLLQSSSGSVTLGHTDSDGSRVDDGDFSVWATLTTMENAEEYYSEAAIPDLEGEKLKVDGVGEEAEARVVTDNDDIEPTVTVTLVARNGNLVIHSDFKVKDAERVGATQEAMLNVSVDTLNDIFNTMK